MKSTTKQINFAMHLLGENSYSTKFMDAKFKDLGAGMRQRSGKVEDWLKSLNASEISGIIDKLKSTAVK